MKSTISLMTLSLVFCVYNTAAQVKIGILAGPQFATRNYNNETGAKTSFNTTLNAGLTALIPLDKSFYLHETIGYSGKGALGKDIHFTDNLGNYVGDGNIHLLIHYIELRTPLVYHTSISPNVDLIAGAGVYAGYALGGYSRITGDNIYTVNGEKKYDIEFELDGFKRFDFGLVGEINFLLRHKILVGLSSDIGLVKVEEDPWHKIRNTSFAISFGYIFNSKTKKTSTK